MEFSAPLFPDRIVRWAICFVFFFAINSCDRENDEPPIPVLFTGDIVEISDDGSVFTGIFKNIRADEVTDFGFLWSLEENPNLDNALKHSLPLPLDQEFYTFMNSSSLIRNTTYYMRIFVTYNDGKTYYGNAVSFYSLGSRAPDISNVVPGTACFGDTVKILGDYFGIDPDDKHVYFGEDRALVIHASDTCIEVQVPYFTSSNTYFTSDKVTIKLIRTGFKTASTELFDLSPPRVHSFTPDEGYAGAELTITGSGFHPEFTDVMIGSHPCVLQAVNDEQIEVLLPSLFQEYEGSLNVRVARRTNTPGSVKILGPAIGHVFPDTVFSYETLSLYGQNLDNGSLYIEINDRPAQILDATDDSLSIEVPGEICSDRLTITMILTGNSQLCSQSVAFRQPENIEVRATENQLFDGSIEISGDYLPEARPELVQLNGMNSQYSYSFTGSSSSINIEVPADIQPLDERLAAYVDFCPSTRLSLDSVFHIPPPVLSPASETMYSYSSFSVPGENFNARSEQNQVFLGDTYLRSVVAPSADLIPIPVPEDWEAGTYPLKVVTNGQESNTVNVEYVHRWNKLSDLPEEMFYYPVLLLHDNVLYMGGGDHETSSDNFYSYNVLTQEWSTRNPLPVSHGLSFSDVDYGYVYGNGALYRYEFTTDTWTLLSQNDITCTSGFLYDNKIFILTVGIANSQYYYDLAENNWVEFDGYQGSTRLYGSMESVLGQGEAYIFHDWDIYTLDLSDLSISDTNEGHYPDYNESPVGFEYNGEAYLYGHSRGLEAYDTQTFEYRFVGGPDAYRANVIRDGNTVYLMNGNELWTFDLTMQ